MPGALLIIIGWHLRFLEETQYTAGACYSKVVILAQFHLQSESVETHSLGLSDLAKDRVSYNSGLSSLWERLSYDMYCRSIAAKNL